PALSDSLSLPTRRSSDLRTGTVLLVVVRSPSSPWLLEPQQYPMPPVVSPHVWVRKGLRLANVSPPATATGVRLFVVVPSPSWPRSEEHTSELQSPDHLVC